MTRTGATGGLSRSRTDLLALLARDRPRTASLAVVQAGLAARAAYPANFVFTGSSTTTGVGASVQAARYVDKTKTIIQAAYPSGIGSETPTYALTSATPSSTAPGVHVYNGGVSGATSAAYLTDTTRGYIAGLNPRMVCHMVGSNDFRNEIPLATFKANVIAHIAALKATIAGPCVHLLVHAHERWDWVPPTLWDRYAQQLRDIADADPDSVAYIDNNTAFRLAGVPGADPLDLIGTDLTHCTDRGHLLHANQITAALGAYSRAAAPGTVLVQDSFSRADSATTLGNASTGQTWSYPSGTWGISAYHAYAVVGGLAMVEAGRNDVMVECNVMRSTSGGSAGLGARATGAADRISVFFNAGNIALALIQGGGINTVASVPSPVAAGVSARLGLSVTGTQVTGYINGVSFADYTLTTLQASQLNGQGIALRQGNGGVNDSAFDDLIVTATSAT